VVISSEGRGERREGKREEERGRERNWVDRVGHVGISHSCGSTFVKCGNEREKETTASGDPRTSQDHSSKAPNSKPVPTTQPFQHASSPHLS
jgi:hypothetical protein